LRRPALRALLSLPGNKQFKRNVKHAYEKGYGAQSSGERYAMRVSIHDEAGLRKLYTQEHLAKHRLADTYGYLLDLANNCIGCDDLDALDYATIRSYLEEDILVKVDRMSMAVSLEARCPLLDQKLANLVQTIPAHFKMNSTGMKYVLKKMVVSKGLVPKEIAMRKKQGFGAPIMDWMQRKEWKEVVSSVLDPMINNKSENRLFDRDYVKSLMVEPYLNSSKLFALITFGVWHRIYVEEDRVAKTANDIPVLV
jgi:asparagine synthase (glutamine-hydrolysing)